MLAWKQDIYLPFPFLPRGRGREFFCLVSSEVLGTICFSPVLAFPVCCTSGHADHNPKPREVGVGASVIRVEGSAMVCILVQ